MRGLNFYPLATIISIIFLDGLSKALVIIFHLPHRLNTGGAFALMNNFGGYTTFALWLVILLGILGLWLTRRENANQTLKTGWASLMGGAIANTLDRLSRGGVLDFLQVGPLPTFNFADLAIVLGLVIISLAFLTPFKAISR